MRNLLTMGADLDEVAADRNMPERDLAGFTCVGLKFNIVFHQSRPQGPDELTFMFIFGAHAKLKRIILLVLNFYFNAGVGKILTPKDKPEGDYHLSVGIYFEGASRIQYVLSVSSDVAVSIASKILREDATRESEEVVEDAVKEFANIVCGNAVAKLAQMGIQSDISPPETLSAIPQPSPEQKTVVFPVRLAEGGLDLRFTIY